MFSFDSILSSLINPKDIEPALRDIVETDFVKKLEDVKLASDEQAVFVIDRQNKQLTVAIAVFKGNTIQRIEPFSVSGKTVQCIDFVDLILSAIKK